MLVCLSFVSSICNKNENKRNIDTMMTRIFYVVYKLLAYSIDYNESNALPLNNFTIITLKGER